MNRYALDGSVFTYDDIRAWLAHNGLEPAGIDDTHPGRVVLLVRVPWWRRLLSACGIGRSMLGLTLDLQDDLEHRTRAGVRFVVQIVRWRPW